MTEFLPPQSLDHFWARHPGKCPDSILANSPGRMPQGFNQRWHFAAGFQLSNVRPKPSRQEGFEVDPDHAEVILTNRLSPPTEYGTLNRRQIAAKV